MLAAGHLAPTIMSASSSASNPFDLLLFVSSPQHTTKKALFHLSPRIQKLDLSSSICNTNYLFRTVTVPFLPASLLPTQTLKMYSSRERNVYKCAYRVEYKSGTITQLSS